MAWPSSIRRTKVLSLEEKPRHPKSSYVPACALHGSQEWLDWPEPQTLAARRLEITDLNRLYLEQDRLSVRIMGRGYAGWTPARTTACPVMQTSSFTTLEQRQGLNRLPREVAWRQGWIEQPTRTTCQAALQERFMANTCNDC